MKKLFLFLLLIFAGGICFSSTPVTVYPKLMKYGYPVKDINSSIYSPQFRNGLILELLPGNWHLNGSTVDIWYDSSGQGRNATQTTALRQPTVLANGNLSFNGTNNSLYFTNNTASSVAYICVHRITDNTPADTRYILGTKDPGPYSAFGYPTTFWNIYFKWGSNDYSKGDTSATYTTPVTFGIGRNWSANEEYYYTQWRGVNSIGLSTNKIDDFNMIGAYYDGVSRVFNGEIIAIWQWNREFSHEEFNSVASIAISYCSGR